MLERNGAAKAAILALFRAEGYLVRWTDEHTSRGDFDGRDCAIEIFNVPTAEQRDVRRRIRSMRSVAEQLSGGPVMLIFHTPEATVKHYRHIVEGLSKIENALLASPIFLTVHGSLSELFLARIELPIITTLARAA